MFKKDDYKLKADFRKLLYSSNERYQSKMESEERRAVLLMWTKIVGESGCIAVSRFVKHGYRLGIEIKTVKSHLGNLHEISNIEAKSCVSKNGTMQTGDVLLEVNGVNLLLLSYAQLVLTIGALPTNIQFVHWKKEGEGVYERPDSLETSTMDDYYRFSKKNEDLATFPINIFVQSSRTKPYGIEFSKHISKSRNIVSHVIQNISRDGYFFDDKRVSVNDSLIKLNGKDLTHLSDKEIHKAFSSNKQSALLVELRKYEPRDCDSDLTSIADSKFSLPVRSKESIQMKKFTNSTPNLRCSDSLSISMKTFPREKPSTNGRMKSETNSSILQEYDTFHINLDSSDDVKIYLVDVKEGDRRKAVICGFHPDSTLRRKFQFKDEIIEVNKENVCPKSSIEIGFILKRLVASKAPIILSVRRKSKRDTFRSDDNLIAPPDMLTTESRSSTSIYSDIRQNIPDSSLDGEIFNVTLFRVNNSFGLSVRNINGPTITEVTPGSEAHKSGSVKVDDEIIKINDVYVMDKDQGFVLTLIRSCSERINLELLRRHCHDTDIQLIENQTYFSNQDYEFKSLESDHDYRHSISQPLPPVPGMIMERAKTRDI